MRENLLKILPLLLFFLLFFSLLPVSGDGGDAGAAPSPRRQADLRHLLAHDCGSCHGLTRQGGLGSPLLPQALAPLSIESLAYIILEGKPGTPMPPWRGLLSQEDALWLAWCLKKTDQEEGGDAC